MEIADNRLYEYAVVRYVPRPDREEFINIGLMMMNKRCRWFKGQIFLDEDRLKIFHPNFDKETLQRQCSLFERTDVPQPHLPIEEKYRWLTAVKSAVIQVSPSHPGILCNDNSDFSDCNSIKQLMEKEFNRLFTILIIS